MRIKFRAWKHTGTPEMFNDVQVIDFKSGIAHLGYSLSSSTERTDRERLDNLILMQYAGLKDNNGTEIYEGDIIWDAHAEIHGKVTFDEGTFCVEWDTHIEHFNEVVSDYYAEVIGNIYENPELLVDSQ